MALQGWTLILRSRRTSPHPYHLFRRPSHRGRRIVSFAGGRGLVTCSRRWNPSMRVVRFLALTSRASRHRSRSRSSPRRATRRCRTRSSWSKAPAKDGRVRYEFSPTLPLPTYLVAIAVGPLDIVDAPAVAPNDIRSKPLPLRGVATRGRGSKLALTLRETPELVRRLEQYFGIAYPTRSST
mgnify:CR=1 FL=1